MSRSALKAAWIGRALTAMGMAAALLAPAPAPTPVQAEHEPGHEPVARLQLFLNEVYIYDDNDPGWFLGAGELHFSVAFPAGVYLTSFSGSSGNTVPLNRVAVNNLRREPGPESESWFPVYAGEGFGIYSNIEERDDLTDTDYLGVTQSLFGERDGWGIGTHTVRAYDPKEVATEGPPADYSLTFEIRRAPVPDLDPVSMKIDRPAGAALDTICVAVVNREVGHADPFWVSLRVNGQVRARQHFSGLAPGEHVDACMADALPPSAELVAMVDEERAVLEYNETNNRLVQAYTAPQPPATPTPGPTQPDLWAPGLLVRSSEAGGGDGCTAGRNDITVLVKNEGASTTTSFVVRLVVDDEDDEAREETVAGLDAGKELEVKFDNVRVRRGLHEFEATVDAKKWIAELNENNNTFKTTFNCRED
jgi:hypothetical protein